MQGKSGNRHLKSGQVLCSDLQGLSYDHKIAALHISHRRFQCRTTAVVKRAIGCNDGLLTHDAVPFHFLHPTAGSSDHPVA